jgi:hypothetical protein
MRHQAEPNIADLDTEMPDEETEREYKARLDRLRAQGLEQGCANSPACATRTTTRAGNVTPYQMFAILGWHTGPGRVDPFFGIVSEPEVGTALERLNKGLWSFYARPVTITFAD